MNWYKTISNFILNWLNSAAVKSALLLILGSASGAGILAWLITFITENAFNLIAKPIIQASIRKGFLAFDIVQGHYVLGRVTQAKQDNDEKTYIKYINRV